MHYQLGRLIKQRYTVENNLLSPNYTRNELYVRSTDIDRTLMSVLSQLSAIYPPEDNQVSDRSVYVSYMHACVLWLLCTCI